MDPPLAEVKRCRACFKHEFVGLSVTVHCQALTWGWGGVLGGEAVILLCQDGPSCCSYRIWCCWEEGCWGTAAWGKKRKVG